MDAKDLLIADLEHFGDSMAKNEEVGEKRLTYFVSLLTAIGAGLTALATAEHQVDGKLFHTAAGTAIATLLIIGLLSYLRMIHRNRVTDEYQRTLTYIRQKYASLCPGLDDYKVPRHRETWSGKWLRGGHAETFAIMEGMLLIAFLIVAGGMAPSPAAAAGVGLAAFLWWCAAPRDKTDEAPSRYFRAGGGAVIVNARGQVLVLERSDVPGAWQLPQGGLEQDEEPLDAILREVMEETGISREKLELLARYPEPLVYELPAGARSPKTGLGQVQYWFLFRYRGEDADIRLPPGGEFRAWEWRPFDEVVAGAIEFRRSVYRRLRDYFGTLGVG